MSRISYWVMRSSAVALPWGPRRTRALKFTRSIRPARPVARSLTPQQNAYNTTQAYSRVRHRSPVPRYHVTRRRYIQAAVFHPGGISR